MYAIEALSLSKKFGSLQALSDIDFAVHEGETFGFLGPNGAGKTTTIRILTGISPPTAGTARIFGRDIVSDTIAARRQMGIVHETSNIYTDLTAWQNLMFTAELYNIGREEREKRGTALLELFGLSERRDDRTRGFSKGMKRRLTLAMGLINHPRLLFLDEPTSGLDVQSNLIIRDVIRTLNHNGVTVFLTISKEGVITYVNPLGATMLGRNLSEIIGHNITGIFPPDVASHQMDTIRTLFMNGKPRRGTTLTPGPKGTITFDTYLVPVKDATGEVISVLGISWDISNLKNKEDALIRINHQLNLLSDITRHDILNKISVISGYITLARKNTKDAAMLELLNKIEPPTTNIRSLIDATKIYQNLGAVEPGWQSLAAIVGGLTPPETLKIVSNVGGVTILADPMFDKVFANLLDNTLRHGVSATRVTVSWENTGNGICIIWQDNGVGVPDDDKEKIFERGFGKNTGLGLFLVRDILALTHIHIRETGTQGKGARFEMAVPHGVFRYSS